ncbi:hypothetical protein SLOPH_579 [Spraguea lophii 42_110]|uniref:Nop domain-containing protein n=1 Tax=Spraguea lophii (strain 42_110) TaxID=1358809 RepID=S7W878_SPRLO|nr:hypothetical protein SLOPH_579 [Spraguea lophii 42_110]
MLIHLQSYLTTRLDYFNQIQEIKTFFFEFESENINYRTIKELFKNSYTNNEHFFECLQKYFKCIKDSGEEDNKDFFDKIIERYFNFFSETQKQEIFNQVTNFNNKAEEKHNIKKKLIEEIKEKRKNVLDLIDVEMLIKIYERAGSEEKVILSNISLIMNIKDNGKYLLEMHPLMDNMTTLQKQKLARFLANKIILAIKIDYFSTDENLNYKKQLEEKKKQLTIKNEQNVLERPVFKKKVRRGKKR